jgi:hypothetical protein
MTNFVIRGGNKTDQYNAGEERNTMKDPKVEWSFLSSLLMSRIRIEVLFPDWANLLEWSCEPYGPIHCISYIQFNSYNPSSFVSIPAISMTPLIVLWS